MSILMHGKLVAAPSAVATCRCQASPAGRHADGPAWRAGARGLGSLVRHPEGCGRHLSRLSRSFRRPLGPPAPDAGRGLLQVPPALLPHCEIKGVVVTSIIRCSRPAHELARRPGGAQAQRGAAIVSACPESVHRGPCKPVQPASPCGPSPHSMLPHVHVRHPSSGTHSHAHHCQALPQGCPQADPSARWLSAGRSQLHQKGSS